MSSISVTISDTANGDVSVDCDRIDKLIQILELIKQFH